MVMPRCISRKGALRSIRTQTLTYCRLAKQP